MKGVSKEVLQWLERFLEQFHLETTDLEGSGKFYPIRPLNVLAHANLKEHCERKAEDTHALALLKERAMSFIASKYAPSMMQKVATFLWPNYRHLNMLSADERQEVGNTSHARARHDAKYIFSNNLFPFTGLR